jgi:hypothetical protein
MAKDRTAKAALHKGAKRQFQSVMHVGADYLREIHGIPTHAIPGLLEECQGAGPDEWDRVAAEWKRAEAERLDKEYRIAARLPPMPHCRKAEGLPDLPEPLDLSTIAGLRAAIRRVQAVWIEGPRDGFSLLTAHYWLSVFWNAAILIEGAPTVPAMPAPLPSRVSDIQQAIEAAWVFLRWCDSAENANDDSPGRPG